MSDERFTGHLIYQGGLMRNEHFQFYDNSMRISYEEVVSTLNSQSEAISSYDKLVSDLRKENEQLRKERDYWEQSSKHRQRLLEECEKKNDKKLFKQKVIYDGKTLTVKTDPNQRVIY